MTFLHPAIVLAAVVERESRADPPVYAGPSIMFERRGWFWPAESIIGSSAAAGAELGIGFDADGRAEYLRQWRARKRAEPA